MLLDIFTGFIFPVHIFTVLYLPSLYLYWFVALHGLHPLVTPSLVSISLIFISTGFMSTGFYPG